MRFAFQMVVLCLWTGVVLGGTLSGKVMGPGGGAVPVRGHGERSRS